MDSRVFDALVKGISLSPTRREVLVTVLAFLGSGLRSAPVPEAMAREAHPVHHVLDRRDRKRRKHRNTLKHRRHERRQEQRQDEPQRRDRPGAGGTLGRDDGPVCPSGYHDYCHSPGFVQCGTTGEGFCLPAYDLGGIYARCVGPPLMPQDPANNRYDIGCGECGTDDDCAQWYPKSEAVCINEGVSEGTFLCQCPLNRPTRCREHFPMWDQPED